MVNINCHLIWNIIYFICECILEGAVLLSYIRTSSLKGTFDICHIYHVTFVVVKKLSKSKDRSFICCVIIDTIRYISSLWIFIGVYFYLYTSFYHSSIYFFPDYNCNVLKYVYHGTVNNRKSLRNDLYVFLARQDLRANAITHALASVIIITTTHATEISYILV